jgi:hypothetical protein
MKIYLSIIACLVLFLAGCQKQENPINSQDDFISLDKRAVPIKVTFDGLATISLPPTSECGPMLPASVINGEGNCSQMGSFTSISVACIVPDAVIQGKGTFINGTHTVTGANGHQMFAEWHGTYETDIPNNIVYYVLDMTITGGTGKFTCATGSLLINATAPYNGPAAPKEVHASGEGSIEFKNLKPFSGKLEGSSDQSSSYSCGTGFTARLCEVEGNTNLGYSEAILEHCSIVTSMEGGLIKNGTATLSTPDGDIFFSYETEFVFDQYPPNYAYFPNMACKITGGTGKYLNVQGSVLGGGIQTLTPSGPTPLTIEFKGWLVK